MTKLTLTGRLVSNIFTAKEQQTTGVHKFWAQVVLDDNQLQKLKDAKQQALKEIFGDKIPQGSGLVDYVERIGDDPEYDLTFEKHFVRASSVKPIKTYLKVSGQLSLLEKSDAAIYFYPGAYVAISLDIYGKTKAEAQNMGGKAFITTGVRGLLFLRHGEPLSDGNVSENEFESYESQAETEDFSE
jgi:hypothetical protein